MRAAENCMCILDQSAVHGSRAECTWIRFSAQKTDYTVGISWRLSIAVALFHIFSGLRAKIEIHCKKYFPVCAQKLE